jgi:hypothetical protein
MRLRKRTISFFVAIFFCAANLFSYYRMSKYSIADGFAYFGWPFSIYGYGGFVSHSDYIWTGLIGNVFVALAAVRVLWWIVEKLSARVSL